MDLTKEEEGILEGDPSEASTKAMGILVNYGELQEADRLIPIRSAHVSGVSYLTAGEALLMFLGDMVMGGGRASVPSSLNPAGMDLERWKEMGIPEEFASKQIEIISLFRKLGITINCSCIPYEIPGAVEPISFGDHLAWGESNAVIYANSMVGARTNREGGISSLASAIIGKTPNWGMHLDEDRIPTLEVNVKGDMDHIHYDLLGAYLGVNYNSDVCYIKGLKKDSSKPDMKHLGAAMAAKGGHAIYHVEGVTPEMKLVDMAYSEDRIREIVDLDISDLERAKDDIYPEELSDTDGFVLGCPQFGPEDFIRLAKAIGERRIRSGKRLLVFTSREARSLVDPGILDDIERSGVEIYNDTCMVVTPLGSMGMSKVGTDSGKAAHYIPKLPRIPAGILPLEMMVDLVMG